MFLKATSEPFDEEGQLTEEKLKNWLKLLKINLPDCEPIYVHASGHASGQELVEMIEEVNPKLVFPVHTENSEIFKRMVSERVLIPAVGKKFNI